MKHHFCNYQINDKIGVLIIAFSDRKKVQVGNDQEKAQSDKDYHSKNQGGGKLNNQKTYRKPNEQLFSQYVATQLPKLN